MTGKVDLLLKGGRVMDPSVGLDAQKDVAFKDGKISAVLDSNLSLIHISEPTRPY